MRAILLAISIVLIAAACGSTRVESSDGRLRIVTTVAPITSITASVVGDRVELIGVVPEGTNSHTFAPAPRIAETLARADLVVINGLQLEEPIKRLAQEVMADGATLVELGDRAIDPGQYVFDFSFPEDGGKPNPHLWTDPALALRYAEIIRDEVSGLDPVNAAYYAANYTQFAATVAALDTAMRDAFETVAEDDRKLVTYHDAYAYFALDYGWTVVGAAQPSDFSEPSARDIAELIDQIEAESVKAVFGSELFPSPVLEQIERETGAIYVDNLRDDDLPGAPGAAEHSWLELMRSNYVSLVEALGGDASALHDVVLAIGVPDHAVYP